MTTRKKHKIPRTRLDTDNARQRVLKEAKRAGIISNDKACRIGKWTQGWYHLNAMAKAGQLKRAGYNQWMPVQK